MLIDSVKKKEQLKPILYRLIEHTEVLNVSEWYEFFTLAFQIEKKVFERILIFRGVN